MSVCIIETSMCLISACVAEKLGDRGLILFGYDDCHPQLDALMKCGLKKKWMSKHFWPFHLSECIHLDEFADQDAEYAQKYPTEKEGERITARIQEFEQQLEKRVWSEDVNQPDNENRKIEAVQSSGVPMSVSFKQNTPTDQVIGEYPPATPSLSNGIPRDRTQASGKGDTSLSTHEGESIVGVEKLCQSKRIREVAEKPDIAQIRNGLRNKCDSLIISLPPSHNIVNVLPIVWKTLRINGRFVFACEYLQVLLPIYHHMKHSKIAIDCLLSESWVRSYQVLSERPYRLYTSSAHLSM